MKNLYLPFLFSTLLASQLIAQPTITSFSPTSATVGTEVNIIGTNYDETTTNNIVRFNGVTASVNSVVIDTIGYLIDHSQVDGFINFVRFTGANADDLILSVGDDAFETTVEIRFGVGLGQKAHRFTRTTFYVYQDYVDVPFEVWDVTNNRQLMASFRDQQEDGVYSLIPYNTDGDPSLESREYIYISDVLYDAVTPDPNIAIDEGLTFKQMYFFWPYLEEGATWSPTNMSASNITIYYDPTITGSIYTNVPVNATTGPITVEVAAQTATSSSNFNVIATTFASLPYLPSSGGNFETNQGDWQVEHTSGTTFELGSSSVPGKNGTASGSFAWVTGLNDDNYVDNSNSSLISPSFNFSSSTQYKMSFKSNFQFEQDWDGFFIQYSIGGGTWTKLNDNDEEGWYNSISDPSAVFGESVPIFSGTTNGTFESFETDLSFLNGNSDVRFKYVFLTDGSVTDVGMALDDFQIIPASGILAFSIPEQIEEAYIRPGFVDIKVASGTDVSVLIPTFTLNSGATATVNSVVQTSGSSAQDFTNPVTYTITAQDANTTQDWIVSIIPANIYASYSFSGNFLDENGEHNGTELTAANAFLDDRLGFANNAFHFSYHNTPTIELQNTANENFGDGLSISAWIRPDNYVVEDVQILTNEIFGLGFNFFLAADDLNGTELLTERRLYAGITGVSYGAYGKVLLDRWTHVAFTFERGVGTTIFINGVNQGTYGFLPGTEDIPIPISSGAINIGKDYDGMMDEIKIFANTLTDEEIQNVFNENRWPFNSLAFRGPEGGSAIDYGLDLNNPGDRYVEAVLISDPGMYQFRATATDFDVFMGDNESDGIAEPGAPQLNMNTGLYGISFRKTDFEYDIVPITSVGIIGSALPDGWNSGINLTDLGNGNYEITNLAVTDGEWKIRINEDWAMNWGSNSNDGFLNPDGDNIPITAGLYSFSFDIVNQTYSVVQEVGHIAELLLHYTFDGNAIDQSNYGNNGTVNGPILTTDRHGNSSSAFSFDGSDDDITINGGSGISINNDLTFNMWVYFTVAQKSRLTWDDSIEYGDLLINDDGTLAYNYDNGSSAATIYSAGALSLNAWNMISFTREGANIAFYINGVLDKTETAHDPSGASQITNLGEGDDNVAGFFNGKLDDVRIYEIALIETDIAILYSQESVKGTQADFTDFILAEQTGAATIGSNTIDIEVSSNTNLTNLVPTFELSEGASASINGAGQVSGTTSNDFTNPISYTVRAENGSTTKNWVVTVTVEPNTETEITTFRIPEEIETATFGTGTIDLTVRSNTNLSSLIATFTLSEGAMITVNGTQQISGSTANDFTNMVTYVVTAEDGTTTQNWDVNVTQEGDAVAFTLSTVPTTVDASFGSTISVDVVNNNSFNNISFLYRGISDGPSASFLSKNTTNNGTIHSATLSGDEDPLGVQYKFTGELTNGNTIETDLNYINITHSEDGLRIPSDRIKFSEKDSLAYRAISIPLNMNNGNSSTLFDELGNYGENWRLYSFNPSSSSNGGSFQEQSTSGTSIQIGKGYFILAKSSASIFTGEGSTPNVTYTEPVEIQIRQGWNLIGNPYNFSIDWSEVLAANTDVNNIDQLSNQLSVWLGSYSNSQNYLLSFQGGFVLSPVSMTIKIPVTRNSSLPTSGGRIIEREKMDTPAWLLTIDLKKDKQEINRLKLGMHENALIEYDKYDQVTLPNFASSASLKVPHPEFFVPSFSSDIVSVEDYFEWDIKLDRSKEGVNYNLSWNIEDFEQTGKSRILFDVSNHKRINMDEVNNYPFKSVKGQIFKVYYGNLDEINTRLVPSSLALGDIYPNPITDHLVIPFNIPELQKRIAIDISLYNLQGEKISNIYKGDFGSGFHQLTWDVKKSDGSKFPNGLYFIVMNMGSKIQSKKIILQ